jgi:hypothetical protein
MQLEVQASRPLQKAARVAPLGRWYMSGSSCQVEKSVRCLELHVPCSSAGHSQLFPTAPLTQKNTSKSCTPKPVGCRRCSTWTKQHKRQAQAKPRTEYMPLTGAPQTAGERLLRPQFNVDDFRGFTGHSQKRS